MLFKTDKILEIKIKLQESAIGYARLHHAGLKDPSR
jgi:hypothetical protein